MRRTIAGSFHAVIAAVTFLAVTVPIAAGTLPEAIPIPVEVACRPPRHEISLDVQGFKKGYVNLEAPSGATLSILLSANGELGIGTAESPAFPASGQTGWILFADPDGCYSWVPGAACPIDETLLEFTPDIDLPDLFDGDGNVERRIGLTDFGGGGRPVVYQYNGISGLNDRLAPIGAISGNDPDEIVSSCSNRWMYSAGPCTTDADCADGYTCRPVPASPDGYGYGADDDLPGLVILSDAGVGLVLDEHFDFPPGPRQARNLAGFVNAVSYQLNDATLRTSVVAHMNTPTGLFAPVALHDNCFGLDCDCFIGPTACTGTRSRVDGGPMLDDVDINQVIADWLITVRVFVVSGTAPSVLEDMNGDGIVNAKDAQRAGYRLLSGEEVLQFRVYRDPTSNINWSNFDFDGNGIFPPTAPVTAGGLSQVPR